MRKSISAGALFLVTAVLPLSADAAPQILALSETAGVTPMTCQRGECSAQLSALCLEEARPMPKPGTAYAPVEGAAITLIFARPDGTTVARPAAGIAEFFSLRGHMAVRVRLDADTLARLGARSVAIRVGSRVTLAPQPVAGDPSPITPLELREAAGRLREAAVPLVDGKSSNIVAARIMNRVINRLPGVDGDSHTVVARLWRREIARTDAAQPVKNRELTDGLAIARHWQAICEGYPRWPGALRKCLEMGHDTMMTRINRTYWKIVGPGS
jgi:hypothetical protein